MLEIKKIKENPSQIISLLNKRGGDFSSLIKTVLTLDKERIEKQKKLDSILEESNNIATKIGELAKKNDREAMTALKEKAIILKTKSKNLIQQNKEQQTKIHEVLIKIPNITHISVPQGNSEKDNKLIMSWEDSPNDNYNSSNKLLPHWELAKKYDIIDFELGAKITGSGFPLYKGMGAQLQRGLINFFLDYNINAGYTEYIPPYLVNEKTAFNTGQLPDKEGMMYHINDDNLYIIPTAEVPITNIFAKKRFQSTDLPIKCTAYSPCFRREAGSYGKEVRGLNRLHQFDKVEIVQICNPKDSYKILDEMVTHVSELLKKLDLQFKIVQLCAGDLGFTSALTYDFEVYAPAQKKWLEVSSVSNFETYQANRLQLKCYNNDNMQFCHTLNGSSLALPRIMAAILEKNQKENKIVLPKILQKYMNFNEITL